LRNIDYKIDACFLVIITCISLGLLAGCQHNPVYPDIGSVYIYTDPDQAEVIMDGQMLRLITPVKIDGIKVGQHTFTLRHNNYKATTFQMEVKPGQVRSVYKNLTSITLLRKDTLWITAGDMCYLEETGEIFLSNLSGNQVTIAKTDNNGQISVVNRIETGTRPRLLAANHSANRLFVTKISSDGEEEISGYDLVSGKMVRSIYLRDIKYYSTLTFSPDGSILIAADSLNKKLVLMDPRLCSVIKTIGTPGSPTDISFCNDDPAAVYVTMSGTNLFALIDLESGEVLKSIPTGKNPGAIFWDKGFSRIGFSNRSDLTYTIVNRESWTFASSANQISGFLVVSACWSNSQDYILWAMDYMLGTLYVPNWQQTSKIFNGGGQVGPFKLIKLIRPTEGNILLMLNTDMLVTVAMDL